MTTIQPITVAAPPFAALYLSGLPAGTARVEVWRRWRGVSERVRGDGQVVVLGGEASLIDWGLPVSTAPGRIVTNLATNPSFEAASPVPAGGVRSDVWAADGSWSLHVPDEGFGVGPFGATPFGI